jgi:DNA-binding transcriptional ArsR family regulator
MLEALFGNPTAEAVLMFLGVNEEAYAKEISDRTKIAFSQVHAQLKRLERGGVLVSRPRGRMRFYSLNPRFVFHREIREMLQQALEYLPDEQRERYVVRRRPRAPGKPLR